ncbi:hypothetical protein [Pseudomonas sp. PONIH3]
MTPAWGFLILFVLMMLGTVALFWAGVVRRKRCYEEFLLKKNNRIQGERP